MTIELNNESTLSVNEHDLLLLAHHVLQELHVHPDTELGILFVDEQAMTSLHEEWMNEPGPTDVLSFPMDELRPGRPDSVTPAGMLGDIVICPQVAAVQADAAGHSVHQETKILLTHGMLHLLGFDHADPIGEHEMFTLQNRLVATFMSPGTSA